MYFVQYVTAISAGLIGELVSNVAPRKHPVGHPHLFFGDILAPFDLAAALLFINIPIICFLWDENYASGDSAERRTLSQSLNATLDAFKSFEITALGVVVASFEGCMHMFVLNWSPALESEKIPPRHGLIFSMFMMACMCGSLTFSVFKLEVAPVKILFNVMIIASLAMGVVVACVNSDRTLSGVFVAFLVFEGCCGMYFPTMGTFKSQLVPAEARAAVYSAYRIPLNFIVATVLLCGMSLRGEFLVGCCLLATALGTVLTLLRRSKC
eukprot:gnl/TRDRNA2_/TRDRNA2_111588_c1_seq1.p1 gnl/TRDRNA2_/TRDRNA2_111588_c1~~gnl/TRDRNA2_/TRDRNA2_111588_c1_seq1.p1  ORF type:complete len:279 (+),score=16.50 gnl/TRDRNA2_/TRDRNA2_111588_c1_seq1:34-837(+)